VTRGPQVLTLELLFGTSAYGSCMPSPVRYSCTLVPSTVPRTHGGARSRVCGANLHQCWLVVYRVDVQGTESPNRRIALRLQFPVSRPQLQFQLSEEHKLRSTYLTAQGKKKERRQAERTLHGASLVIAVPATGNVAQLALDLIISSYYLNRASVLVTNYVHRWVRTLLTNEPTLLELRVWASEK